MGWRHLASTNLMKNTDYLFSKTLTIKRETHTSPPLRTETARKSPPDVEMNLLPILFLILRKMLILRNKCYITIQGKTN